MTSRHVLTYRRSVQVAAVPDRVFAEVERLGGTAGWPAANLLWQIRGLIDRWAGGVGMRGRRHDREHLVIGDSIDFWRVEALERPRLLRLHAEMRVPGSAWLEFELEPTNAGSDLVQTASFEPYGLAGYAYWYLLLPIHAPIFRRLIGVVAARASHPGAPEAQPRTS